MRVVAPTSLLLEAVEVLDPIHEDVVVIGALAVQIALDGHDIDRDFSDAALLLDRLGDVIAAEVAQSSQMRGRVERAAERLLTDQVATAAAARELVRSGQEETHDAAETMVRRAAGRCLRQLDQ